MNWKDDWADDPSERRKYNTKKEGKKYALARVIQEYRVAKGFTQAALARRLGLRHSSAIAQYECGTRLPPLGRDEELQRILGIPKEEYDEAYKITLSTKGAKTRVRRKGLTNDKRIHDNLFQGYYNLLRKKYFSADDQGKREIRQGLEKLIEGTEPQETGRG